MIEFLLTFDRDGPAKDHPDLPNACIERPEKTFCHSGGAFVLNIFWAPTHPFESCAERISESAGGLRLLIGYPMDQNARPIRAIDDFDPEQSNTYTGTYFFLSLTDNGHITCAKSLICAYPLYSSVRNDREALASRAGLAHIGAYHTAQVQPSSEFLRWTATYAIGGTPATAYQGVKTVQMNQKIAPDASGLNITDPDFNFLSDQGKWLKYISNPVEYWDETFEFLRASTQVLDLSDQPIEFPLSGGKDSRLLLGFLVAGGGKPRLSRVFTRGAPDSPDVRAAALVCEALGLDHSIDTSFSNASAEAFTIDDKLLRHLHITEGELSPDALVWGLDKLPKIEIHGQEGGLRNMTSRIDILDRTTLLDWFDAHLGYGDRCQMFQAGVAEQTLEDIRAFVDSALAADILPENIPTLHRVIYRLGRWGAKIWRSYNDRWFAPFLFVEAEIIKATFNTGAVSRIREEFHFEMMRRINPDLAFIPFANQTWDATLRRSNDPPFPDPFLWKSNLQRSADRATFVALLQRFPQFQSYFSKPRHPEIEAVLDRDRLAAVDIAEMHPSTYQSYWQLLQMALIAEVGTCAGLDVSTPTTEFGLPSFNI